jgi:hypothetical protein
MATGNREWRDAVPIRLPVASSWEARWIGKKATTVPEVSTRCSAIGVAPKNDRKMLLSFVFQFAREDRRGAERAFQQGRRAIACSRRGNP